MYYEGALGFGPPRPATGVGGPGAFLTVAGSFLLATCNAEFIGGGGMANRYQNCAVLPLGTTPRRPQLSPQGWGRFFWASSGPTGVARHGGAWPLNSEFNGHWRVA